MDIEVTHHGTVAVVRLHGRITDGEPAAQMRAILLGLVSQNVVNTVIDLEEVTWFDSLAIGLLVRHYVSTSQHGGKTILLNANEKIRTLMTLVHLEERFGWASTLEEAIAPFEA